MASIAGMNGVFYLFLSVVTVHNEMLVLERIFVVYYHILKAIFTPPNIDPNLLFLHPIIIFNSTFWYPQGVSLKMLFSKNSVKIQRIEIKL